MARQLIIKGANFQANSFDNDKYVIEEITLTPISTHGYSTTTAPKAPYILDHQTGSVIKYANQDVYSVLEQYKDGHWGGAFFDVSQYRGCDIYIDAFWRILDNSTSWGALFTNTNSVNWAINNKLKKWIDDANVISAFYSTQFEVLDEVQEEGFSSANKHIGLSTQVPLNASYLYVQHRNSISEYPLVVKVYVVRS